MLFRFWRWLTCGHGRHRWQLHAGLDLASIVEVGWPLDTPFIVAVRHCPRCDTTEVLE